MLALCAGGLGGGYFDGGGGSGGFGGDGFGGFGGDGFGGYGGEGFGGYGGEGFGGYGGEGFGGFGGEGFGGFGGEGFGGYGGDGFGFDGFDAGPSGGIPYDPGSFDSYTFDDGSTVTYGPEVTSSPSPADPAPPPDPVYGMIDEMSPPPEPWNTEAPEVDTTGITPTELTAEQQYMQQIDLLQNYRDGASPGELYQGNHPNCGIITTLNSINQTPEGQAYLQSLVSPNADGSVTVTLTGADGQPMPVTVWPGYDQLSSGDPTLQLIDTAVAYVNNLVPQPGDVHGPEAGTWPNEVMSQLGLSDATKTEGLNGAMTDATGNGPPGATVIDVPMGDGAHAHTVVGAVTHPETGESIVVTTNPWGYDHLQPLAPGSGEGVNHSYTGDLP